MAGVILAAARYKGSFALGRKMCWFTIHPRPYISGVALRALSEQFNSISCLRLEETEKWNSGEDR